MQYFAWGVDRPDAGEQRLALRDEHWAFLDGFEDRLLARGPVLDSDDPSRILGSIHIVELDDDAEARHFAYDEPFARDGVFSDVTLTGYRHELGRTMFEFDSDPAAQRFFVHCPAAKPGDAPIDAIAAAHEAHWAALDRHVLCRGSLLDDAGSWAGRVFLLEAPDRETVARFVADDPCTVAGCYAETAIRRWTMGGAANLKAAGLMTR